MARTTKSRRSDHWHARSSQASGEVGENRGILDEEVIRLVFEHMNFSPLLLARGAAVCKRWADVMKRVVWKEFCLSRQPRMVADLLRGTARGRGALTVAGGWLPVGKLLLHCPGSRQSKRFYSGWRTIPGHAAKKSRFSKTAGKEFLQECICRSDTLYVSGCCVHRGNGNFDDQGLFRGIFRAFETSRTRHILIASQANYEETERCPFCREKVWSMKGVDLVPRSASRKLKAYNDNVEYFVCVNGHLHGMASLLPPPSSRASTGGEHSNTVVTRISTEDGMVSENDSFVARGRQILASQLEAIADEIIDKIVRKIGEEVLNEDSEGGAREGV